MRPITLKERLRYYRGLLYITQEQLASKKLQLQTIKNIECGRRKMKADIACLLVERFKAIADEKGKNINITLKDLMLKDEDYAHMICERLFEDINTNAMNIDVCNEIIEISEKFNLKDIKKKTISYTSDYYYNNHEYKECINIMKNYVSDEAVIEDPEIMIFSLNRIGACFLFLNDNNEAIKYLNRGIEKVNNYSLFSNEIYPKLLYNISLCYIGENQFDDALIYLEKVVKLNYSNKEDVMKSLLCIANINFVKCNYDDAIKMYKELLNKDFKYIYMVQNNIAVAYECLDLLDKSIGFFIDALNNKSREENIDIVKTYIGLGQTYIKMNAFREAAVFYEYALSYSIKFKDIENQIECYCLLYSAYKKANLTDKFDKHIYDIVELMKAKLLNNQQIDKLKLVLKEMLFKSNEYISMEKSL